MLTDSESFGAARLEDICEDGDEREQKARHDDSNDVVERIAMN